MTEPLVFVAVTTHAKSKRHWSLPKKDGWTLCNTTSRVLDQAGLDDAMPPRWRKRTIIVDLPPCLQCDKSRKRLEEETRREGECA